MRRILTLALAALALATLIESAAACRGRGGARLFARYRGGGSCIPACGDARATAPFCADCQPR